MILKICCKLSAKYLMVEEATKGSGVEPRAEFKVRSRAKSFSNSYISLSTKIEIWKIVFNRAKRATEVWSLQK